MLTSLALFGRAWVDPVGAVPRAVEQRRWVLPLAFLILTGAASATAFAQRLDASSQVLPKMEQEGELAKASEREVNEEVEQAERIALVLGVAKAVMGMPLAVLLIAVALKISAWLLGKKALFGACFTTASVAMLPIALFYLLSAIIAWRQQVVIPRQAGELMITSLKGLLDEGGPGRARALAAVDFFNLWSAALLGLGFAASAKVSAPRGVLFGFALYALFAAAVMVGLPGLAAGGPP